MINKRFLNVLFILVLIFSMTSGCINPGNSNSTDSGGLSNTEASLNPGYYRIINKNSGKTIDGRGFTSTPAAVMQWSLNSSSKNQIWSLEEIETGVYTIKNLGTDFFIRLAEDLKNVTQTDNPDSENSKWIISNEKEALFSIKSLKNSLYIDTSGRKSDGRIAMTSEISDESQLWEFIELSAQELSVFKPEILPGKMYFPKVDWTRAKPELQNMDSKLLDEIDSYVNDEKGYEILSLLVARNGILVYEKYWREKNENTRFPVYSISKAFTSSLIGIAYTNGLIEDLDAPVIETYFPDLEIDNPDPRKDLLTIHNILTMQHGYKWNDNEDYGKSVTTGENATQTILGYPMQSVPGSNWNYHTAFGVVLSDIVEIVSKQKATDYYINTLYEPIGITTASWQTDSRGIPLGGIGLSITAADLLRFGHLYLNDGEWDGKRIISKEFVEKSSSPLTNSAWGPKYGYQWFVNEEIGLYYGLGSQGQVIAVIPSKQIVVGVTSATWTGNTFDTIINGVIRDRIMKSVQD